MKQLVSYLIIGAASSAFAFFLSQNDGKKWVDENTALAVIIGSSIIVVGLAPALPPHQWRKVALAFGVAGAPMVARKILQSQIGVV